MTKKQLHAIVAPVIKAAHRAVNDYCVNGMGNMQKTPGYVLSHSQTSEDVVEFDGFTFEWSFCRRAHVVCNVPTPFSLVTFNYCLKREGRQLAHGTTMDEFLTHGMRAIKYFEERNCA
jgi:hypothetical protein